MRSRERGSRTETGGKMSTLVERTRQHRAQLPTLYGITLGPARSTRAGGDVSWNVAAALKRSMKRNMAPDETRREPQGPRE